MIIARFIALSFALLSTACSQLNFAVVNTPSHFDEVVVTKDVSFGEADWQKLDIYKPSSVTKNANLPVIVFYYGGRWTDGDKDNYRFVGSALAKQNYIVVIPDYRKYPDVKFPEFVQDGAKSLAWVSDNIGSYNGDASDIHISGHSAGAHIAAILTTDARYLEREGKDRSAVIRDFVGLAGPYNFIPEEEDLKEIFSPPSIYPQMQTNTFIDGRQPPMLLLWGDKDEYVGKFNMDKLEAAIHEKGGCVKTKVYPGVSHAWLVANLSWLGSKKTPVLQDWMDFIKNTGCGGKK